MTQGSASAADGATFHLTIKAAGEAFKASWIVRQGAGEIVPGDADSCTVATVAEAKRWGHDAARARGFRQISIRSAASRTP